MHCIQTVGLHKWYGKRHILKGLSFEAKSNQVTLLAGRNGVGKTTWLRLALGLGYPSKGSVLYDGKTIDKVREQVAIVCDEPPVYPHLSGGENLKLLSSIRRPDKKWASHIKEILNLEPHFLTLKAGEYSLGQRRRLAIAAAMLRKPNYLFLDEPTVGLDPVAWSMVKQSLKSLASNDTAVILTGQDFNELEKLIDRIVILHDGKIAFEGDVLQLLKRRPPRVRISTNDMNIIMSRFPQAKVNMDSGFPTAEIDCSSLQEAEDLVSTIRKLDIKLQSLSIYNDSLAEAFLAIEGIEDFVSKGDAHESN